MRRLRRRISRRARLIALAITGFALISVAPLGALFATWTTAKSLQVYATLGGGALAAVAAVMATKDEPRGQIPRRLPKGAEVFIGRERDLEKLGALYAEQTATGSSPSAAPASLGDSARARTILIHGQPGVGKRELAQRSRRASKPTTRTDHSTSTWPPRPYPKGRARCSARCCWRSAWSQRRRPRREYGSS